MTYTVKILEGHDPKSKPGRKVPTIALIDEKGAVLETMQVGLSEQQLTDGKLESRLQRYGERLKASYENTGNLDNEIRGKEVEIDES